MRTVFDAAGNKIKVPEDTPVNDLTRAPQFMDELPDGLLFVPIVVASKDGTPMVGLANPTLIATTQEVTEKIVSEVNTARQQFVDEGRARDAVQQTIIDQLAQRKAPVPLGDVSVPASALITLTGGEITTTRTLTGIKTTDIIAVTPKSLSAGYGLRGFSIPSDNNITLRLQAPILSTGGTAQAFTVVAFR